MTTALAVAEALPRTAEALADFARAVRPDPAVAAVRAEQMRYGLVRRCAHHLGALTRAAERLRGAIAVERREKLRGKMRARLAGVLVEIDALR